jgi:kynurenine aminotransferase
MAMEVGVSSIPVSEVSDSQHPRSHVIDYCFQFYCEDHVSIGEAYARFAFCKDLDTLKNAAERLQGLAKYMQH